MIWTTKYYNHNYGSQACIDTLIHSLRRIRWEFSTIVFSYKEDNKDNYNSQCNNKNDHYYDTSSYSTGIAWWSSNSGI